MLPTLTADRLSEREQHELLIRLGFCDGGRYVVEPDGTFRRMRPEDLEENRIYGRAGEHMRVAERSTSRSPIADVQRMVSFDSTPPAF
jgi:hypothetical protein